MRGMLRSGGCRVFKCVKCLGDVPRHRNVDKTLFIIPGEVETEVRGPRPVGGVGVTSGQGGEQVINVGFVKILNAKIVDGKGEGEGLGGVAPETGGVRDGSVTKRCQVSAQLIVGKDGGFFQAIHSFSDLDVGITLGIEVGRGKLILFLDVLWDVLAMNSHVLIDCHVANQEKIFQVGGAISGSSVGIGDDAVPVEFSVDEADGRGADVLICIE